MYKGPKRKFKKKENSKKRKKISKYGEQLGEKQKLRAIYGIREKVMKNYFLKSKKVGSSKESNESLNLIRLMESRLDNVVYKLGWADTIPQARQLVSHAHIIVNGKTIKSGSYNVIVSDKVSIKKSKIDLFPYRHLKTKLIKKIPPIWLKYISPDKMSAEMINNIEFEDFKEPINLSLVIEFYSR